MKSQDMTIGTVEYAREIKNYINTKYSDKEEAMDCYLIAHKMCSDAISYVTQGSYYHFYRGRANVLLQDYPKALNDFESAIKLSINEDEKIKETIINARDKVKSKLDEKSEEEKLIAEESSDKARNPFDSIPRSSSHAQSILDSRSSSGKEISQQSNRKREEGNIDGLIEALIGEETRKPFKKRRVEEVSTSDNPKEKFTTREYAKKELRKKSIELG